MNRVKKEAQKRRYMNTPNGRVDLHSSKALSQDEWIEELNRCNPLDRYAKRQKAFHEPETALDGLILFREQCAYYLLNRSGRAIDELRVEALEADDLNRVLSGPTAYRIEDIPRASYVKLNAAAPEPQRKTVYRLTRVVWADHAPWEGRKQLSCQTPTMVAQHLHQLPLDDVERPVKLA